MYKLEIRCKKQIVLIESSSKFTLNRKQRDIMKTVCNDECMEKEFSHTVHPSNII